MKTLILTVTLLNFMIYFPHNGSQEILNQTNQHFSVNPPLSTSDSHTASQNSSILRTKENSAPIDFSNSYNESVNGVSRLPGSFSKRNHSEILQDTIYNFAMFELGVPTNSSANQTSVIYRYNENTLDNSAQAEVPKSKDPFSSTAVQDISAVIRTSNFAPNSRVTQRRMTVPRENSMAPALSMIAHQYQSTSATVPYFQTNSKAANQPPEYFFLSTRGAKPLFASASSAYIQNIMNKFGISAGERTTVISNTDELIKADPTLHEEEAKPDSISFIDTTPVLTEDYIEDIDSTDILEDDIALFDVPNPERGYIIITDNTDLEIYDKTISNAPALPQKDNSIIINDIDVQNDGRVTVKTQTSSISSIKNNSGFEFIPSTYDKDKMKSMIGTGVDQFISDTDLTDIINYFLNYRMYKKNSHIVSNSSYPKTVTNMDKNTIHVGDILIPKTNSIYSAKQNTNPTPIEPTTNTITNHKTAWSLKNPSNIPANVHLKTDMKNLPSVSSYGVEYGIPVVQETANMDQDDGAGKKDIFINPDTLTAEIRRKIYFLDPNEDYGQTAGDKIVTPSDTLGMFNPLSKYEIKPFTKESKNQGNHIIPTTTTANDAHAKTSANRTTMFRKVNFQKNIAPVTSTTHSGNVGPVYFSENGDKISSFKVSIVPPDKSTDSVYEIIVPTTNNNHDNDIENFNSDINFPMSKELTLLSVTDSSTLSPTDQKNKAQSFLITEDDSLTDAWISNPVTENAHIVDDTTMQKKEIIRVSVDPKNVPLIISPYNEYTAITSADKDNTGVTDNSYLMINKPNSPEKKATAAITSLSTKAANAVSTIKRSGNLTDKVANKEELIPHVNMRTTVKEDDAFQVRNDLLPSHNLKYFESGEIGRNGFATVDTTKSLPQLNSIMPTADVTSDRDVYLITPEEENVNVLHDVTSPKNDKTHFQSVTNKGIANGLVERPAIKQNIEEAGGAEFFPRSNAVPQTGRMDYQMFPNANYYGIIVTKDTNARDTNGHKLSPSTTNNEDLNVYRHGYQTPATINASNTKRLAKKDKLVVTDITNSPSGITITADDFFSVDENSVDLTDLTPTINEGILNKNKVNTPRNKSNKPEDDFIISKEDPNVSRKGDSLLTTDSSTFVKSVSPFNHDQATNPIKKTSLADIIIPKTFQQNFNPEALTAPVTTASQDVNTRFYIPIYEPDNSFTEEITLNYEENDPKEIGIIAKNTNIFTEENVMNPIYTMPIASQRSSKGNYLSNKYYPINDDVYTRLKEMFKAFSDQLEFEDPVLSHEQNTVISKPALRKFIPEYQEKVSIINSNSGAEYDTPIGGNTHYPMMKENVPKGYILSPIRKSAFKAKDFRIPVKNNINPALEGFVLLDKESVNKNYASYANDETDARTKEGQTAKSSPTNSEIGVLPEMFSTPIFSEDISMENGPINRFIPLTYKSPGFVSHIPPPKAEVSESFPHSTTLSEIEPKEKYQTIILKEDNSDSNASAIRLRFPQAESNNASKESKNKIKAASITSLDPAGILRMPTNTITTSPSVIAFKGNNENGDSTMPKEDGTLSKNLKSLSVLKQKKPKPVVALSENDPSWADPSVTLETPEPLGKYSTIIDQNWENNKVQSDTEPFFMFSSVPLIYPTTYSENPDTATTGKVSSDDKMDTITFPFNKFPQTINHKSRGTNVISDYSVNYPVNHVEKISTSEIETNPLLKEKAVTKDKYITEANMPVNLRVADSMNVNSFILKPDIASNEQKPPRTLKQAFYPNPSISTTKLIKSRAQGLFSPDNENVEKSIINSYSKLDPLFLKSTLPPIDFNTDFTEIDSPELDPALILGDSNIKMTDDSTIFNDIIVIPDTEMILPDNNIFGDDIWNIISGNRYLYSAPNFGSDENGPNLKDYTANFNRNSPRTMTHFLTDIKTNFSPGLLDNSALKRGTLSGSDILRAGKWIKQTHALDSDTVETTKEISTPSGEITVTKSPTLLSNKDQFPSKDMSSTVSHVLRGRNPSISPKSGNIQDKTFKEENFHSQDVTVSSVASNVDLDNVLFFADEDYESKKDMDSISPLKTIHTMTYPTVLSLQNSDEGDIFMLLDKSNTRIRKSPFHLTTESILMPRISIESSALMNDNPFTDSSKSASVLSKTVTEHLDNINGTNLSKNQDSKIQTDFLFIIPSDNLANFIRNSTGDVGDSPPTVKQKTVYILPTKAFVQTLTTKTKVLSPFPSGAGKKVKFSAEEDTTDEFYVSHITKATVPNSTLEKTLLSTPTAGAISNKNVNKESEINVSEAGDSVLGDSRALKDNLFFSKFNIFARPKDPPSLKRIILDDSFMSPEKTVHTTDKTSVRPKASTGTAYLFKDDLTGSYGGGDTSLRKAVLAPEDFTTFKYPEIDQADTKVYTTTKANIPLEERNTPTHKVTTSNSISTSRNDTLKTMFRKRLEHRNLVEKDMKSEYEAMSDTENVPEITLDHESIPNYDSVRSRMLDKNMPEKAGYIIPNNHNIVTTILVDDALESSAGNSVFKLVEERSGPFIETSLATDSDVFESNVPYAGAEVSKHLSQQALADIKTSQKHQSKNYATVLKSPTINFNTKTPRHITYFLDDSVTTLPSFQDEPTMEHIFLDEDKNIIIFPKDERIEYPIVPDSEQMTKEERRLYSTDVNAPAMTIKSTEYQDQFNRKSSLDNYAALDEAKPTISSRLGAIKHKPNLAKKPPFTEQHSFH